jgi:carbohydrate kinase (thermoresistant glucokinase family)
VFTVLVLMGVSGSGKSFIGQKLANQLNFAFTDGDDFHSDHNKQKMATGTPLNDHDRLSWLNQLRDFLSNIQKPTILACSALKKSYREILSDHSHDTILIHLTGSQKVLQDRLATRKEHFFNPSLLYDQLATLEPLDPEELGFSINIEQNWEKIIAEIETKLNDEYSLL